MDFLRRSLSQLRPVVLTTDRGREVAFAGDQEAVEYVTPFSSFLGIEVLEGEAGVPEWHSLREGRSRIAVVDEEQEQAMRTVYGQHVLLDRVESLELAFYGLAFGEAEADWHAEWDDTGNMPRALRMRLRTVEESWPELFVSLPDVVLR